MPSTYQVDHVQTTFSIHIFFHVVKAGTYGKVHRGYKQDSTVAIKFADISDKVTFKRELEVYAVLENERHPNICRLICHMQHNDMACLIFESALMDLRQFKSSGQLANQMKPTAALHIVQGLAALHGHVIIHRDLKPDNILVQISLHGPVFQIADFGIARVEGKDSEMTPGMVSHSDTIIIFRH